MAITAKILKSQLSQIIKKATQGASLEIRDVEKDAVLDGLFQLYEECDGGPITHKQIAHIMRKMFGTSPRKSYHIWEINNARDRREARIEAIEKLCNMNKSPSEPARNNKGPSPNGR